MDDCKCLTHSNLEFLRELKKYTFESKMLYCQKYASRIMTISDVSMCLAMKNNIMPWELEAFSTFSIVYNDQNATEVLDASTFSKIITLLRNYWHPELTIAEKNGVYADYFMMISALQQFPTQGVFLQKMFRYDFFFRFSNDKIDMNQIFQSKYENEYRLFEAFAYIVFITCSLEGQNTAGRETCAVGLKKALAIGGVREHLSISKEKYIKLLDELYAGEITDYYYGLKIQYVYPLIDDTYSTYIPLPYLVVNAITESFLNQLTNNDNKLRRVLGKEIIEEYLYTIYREVPTVDWISREFEYKIGKNVLRTPDVLVEESGYAMLFDTKALSPSLRIRKFNKEEIEKETEIYANNILQIYKRILDLVDGRYTLKNHYEKSNIFGIVVVLQDASISRKSVYEKVFKLLGENHLEDTQEICDYIHSHIKITSLLQIEQAVLEGHSYLEGLLSQVDNREKWDDYVLRNFSSEANGISIYEKYCSEIRELVGSILTS